MEYQNLPNTNRSEKHNSERIIITSLGTANYEQCTYQYGKRTYESRFTTVALASMLQESPTSALVLVTEDAREQWLEQLSAELSNESVSCKSINIPVGQDSDELLHIVRLLIEAIPYGAEVCLDVTFGFRHLPFVYLAALCYLVG